MLPFRSGRAGFSGASSAFLLFILLSCAALAAEKIAKPEVTAKSKPKERPKPEEGVTNIPIATGHDAKGLVLPDFDHPRPFARETGGRGNQAARRGTSRV